MRIDTSYLTERAHNLRQLKIKIALFEESNENERKGYIFQYLIMSHLSQGCKIRNTLMLNTCFCNNTSLFYAKKQVNVLTSKNNIMKYQSIFSKILIKSWYDDLLQQQQDNQLMFSYSQFLFYKLSYIGTSLLMIRSSGVFQSYFQQFQIFAFINRIQNKTTLANNQAYRGELKFEQVIRYEKIIDQLQNITQTILSHYAKFWQIFLNYTINQDEILNLSAKIQDKIDEYIQIHSAIGKDVSTQRKQWKFQYLWFKLNIMNKKLKLSELDFPTMINSNNAKLILKDDSQSEDSESDFDLNQQKGSVMKPFDPKTAIIITDQKLDSQFIQVNNFFEELFGYQNVNITQLKLNNIILKSQRRNHETSIKQFLKGGIRNSTFHRTKIFFVHNQGYIIQAQKYLKYIIGLDTQLLFVSMIRPIVSLDSINYIIFNEELDADGMTEGIQQVLQLKQFNLYILAPKLLYYTKFQSLVTQADIKLFDLGKYTEQQMDFFNKKFGSPKKQTVLQKVAKSSSVRNLFQSSKQTNKMEDTVNKDHEGLDSDLESIEANNFQIKTKQHIKIQLRIPQKIEELNSIYRIQRHELQEIKLPPSLWRLIQRDKNGALRIIRFRLLRQIRSYLLLETQSLYDLYKRLYLQYIKNTRNLSKIVILDAQIKFQSIRCIDKLLVLKINRFEVYLNEQADQAKRIQLHKEQTQINPTNPDNLRTEQITELNDLTNLSQNIQTQRITDLSELVESSRQNLKRPFISEHVAVSDFKIQSNFSINLDFQQNIFIKDDNNKANKEHINYLTFKYANRLLILIFLILPIIQYTLGFKYSYNELQTYGTLQFLNYYNYTQQLFITYYAMNNLLFYNYNITRNYQNCQIQTYRCILQGRNYSANEEAEFYKNQTNIYHYILIASNVLLNQNSFMQMVYTLSVDYDNTNNALDMYNQWQNNMQNMNNNQNSKLFINSSTVKYFKTATIPTLYHSTQSTFSMLIRLCINQLNQTYTFTIIVVITQIGVMILMIFFSINQITFYCNKNQNIFEQIFLIERQLVLNIYHQQQISLINYKYLLHLNHLTTGILEYQIKTPFGNRLQHIKSDCNDEVIQEKLCKKDDIDNSIMSNQSKKNKRYIITSKQWLRIRTNYVLLFLVITITTVAFPLTLSIFILTKVSNLINSFIHNTFINEIYPFWILVIFKEYYFFDHIDKSYINSTAYLQILNDFIHQLTNDQNQTIFTTTLTQIDAYFNQDICFSDLLCQGLLNGALNSGIKSYHTLLAQSAQAMLNLTDQRFQYPTASQISEFDTEWTYVSAAYDKIFLIWTNYISDEINWISEAELILFSCCLVVIIISYLLIYETYFFRKLNKSYEVSKQFYKSYFPNQVVNNQKRIRAQLSKCDLIRN